MSRCFSFIIAESRLKSHLTLRYLENQMVRRIFFGVFFNFCLTVLIPPLIHTRRSTCDSPEQASHRRPLSRGTRLLTENLTHLNYVPEETDWDLRRYTSLPDRIFCDFLSPSTKMTGMVLKIRLWPLSPSFQSIHYDSVLKL
jgi:hypothetical protein